MAILFSQLLPKRNAYRYDLLAFGSALRLLNLNFIWRINRCDHFVSADLDIDTTDVDHCFVVGNNFDETLPNLHYLVSAFSIIYLLLMSKIMTLL